MITEKINDALKTAKDGSSEQVIGTYILQHLTEVSGTDKAEIAAECQVDENDLELYAQGLGFAGYKALRDECREYVRAHSADTVLFDENISLAENIENITSRKTENINWCTDHLGQDVMRELADTIVNHNRILIFAQGGTRPMAHYLRTALLNTDKNVLITDQYLRNDYHTGKKDLFIFISLSGLSFTLNPGLSERVENIHADKWLITCNRQIDFDGRRWVVPVKDEAYSVYVIQHAIDLLMALVQIKEN